ncbi:hypothetical protein QBC37DRAFT_416800 [Rhypophila decipiens]|uniref:Uncharacterized protein n=1 Tax=Rhypophila decipiens TaxID=261697 RepID=A0AAN6YEN6_9PEZI|nr:hypothetical protein QBC37DRAFT_416800 [Rhypophila decipiens]
MSRMAQINHLWTRDEPGTTTKAGITLAIILGTTVGGLSLLFAVMGIWLYIRYRRIKRERAAAEEADGGRPIAPENRKSADTMIDYSREIQLNDLSERGNGAVGQQHEAQKQVVENGHERREAAAV